MEKKSACRAGEEDIAAGNPDKDIVNMAAVSRCDIDAIRKTADEFNAAFNAMLNESVLSMRQLDERAGRIAELDDSLQQIGSSLRAAAEKSQQLEQELQEMSAERDHLRQQVDAGRDSVSELERELDSIRAQHRQACAAHTSEKTSLEQQLEALRASLADAEQSLHDSEQRMAEVQAELSGLQAATGELREQNGHLQQEIAARDKAGAERQATLEKVTGDLQSTQEAFRELEQHAQNLENLNKALHDSSASEQNKSRKAIEMRDREIEALRGRLDAQGEAQDGIQQLSGELQELQVKLADAEHQLCQMADLQLALSQAEGKLAAQAGQADESDGLRQEVERLQAEVARLQQSPSGQDDVQAAGQHDCAADEATHPAPDAPAAQNPHPVYPDRGAFMAALNKVLKAERDGTCMAAVAYLLVDDFQQIREETGVLDSDQIAGQIHALLDSCLEQGEMLARFGDCSFAMLLTADDEGGIRQRVEALREAVENRILETGNCTVVATLSIGVAPVDSDDTVVDAVMSRAGAACETASSCGGNQVLVHCREEFTAGKPAVFGDDAAIVSQVLDRKRIRNYYQPISDLKGNASGYYEVLVRIQAEDDHAITPGEFFAMAQRAGMSFEVDCRIIEGAVRVLVEEQEKDTTLFVKLAPETVASEELGMHVMQLLRKHRVNPARLVFEITENKLKQDLKSVAALTQALHSIGCRVAIEHYTMATQVKHLRHIHADFLKIDASLVQDVGEDENKLARTKAIIDIARSNGCKTIAEQVESPYSLTRLWSLGVDFAQGYFIQEPDADRGYDFGGADTARDGHDGKATFNVE